MALQYDFIAGLDCSALASVTQAQLLQMVNQIAPLSNIGGIICQAATPDVASNSRFARYLWIDITDPASPIPKLYSTSGGGTWISAAVADGSITTAKIVDLAVTIAKMSASGGTARYVLRVNTPAANAIEFRAPNGIFNTNELPLNQLIWGAGGGLTQYLRTTAAGEPYWAAPSFGDFDLSTKLSPSNIDNTGAANPSILASIGGAVSFRDSSDTALFPIRGIALSRLADSSAAVGDLMAYDGASWAPRSIVASSTIAIPGAGAAKTEITAGLASVPRFIRAVGYCAVSDAATGYQAGDEAALETFAAQQTIPGVATAPPVPSSVDYRPAFQVYCDANDSNKIKVLSADFGTFPLYVRKATATLGSYALVTTGNWRFKVYYML